jgi:hypothetical protein
MGDYPTELMAGSIYSRHERWLGNWTKMHGGRRRRKLLAQLIRGEYRGGLTGDDRMANVSHGGAVKGWRHGATVVNIADSGDGRKATSPARGTEEQRGHSSLNLSAMRSFPSELNPQPRRMNHGAKVTGGEGG